MQCHLCNRQGFFFVLYRKYKQKKETTALSRAEQTGQLGVQAAGTHSHSDCTNHRVNRKRTVQFFIYERVKTGNPFFSRWNDSPNENEPPLVPPSSFEVEMAKMKNRNLLKCEGHKNGIVIVFGTIQEVHTLPGNLANNNVALSLNSHARCNTQSFKGVRILHK